MLVMVSETIDGTVTRVIFASDESGWCAIRLDSEERGNIAATGTLLGVREGDELRLTGRWIDHPRFGEQFEAGSMFVHQRFDVVFHFRHINLP